MSTTNPTKAKSQGGRPSKGRVKVHTSIDPAIHGRLKRYCDEQSIKINTVIDEALDLHLDAIGAE